MWSSLLLHGVPCHSPAKRASTIRLLPRLRNHALVIPRLDVVDGAEEMALGILHTLGVAVGVRARQVGVDELDQPIQIFRSNLSSQRECVSFEQVEG